MKIIKYILIRIILNILFVSIIYVLTVYKSIFNTGKYKMYKLEK